MDSLRPEWIRDSVDTLSYHRAHPEVSVLEHRDSLRCALASKVLKTKRIYLDTKFWIILRNAHFGRNTTAADKRLLTMLRELVANGIAICPLSYSSIKELWLQEDTESRAATAAVMDELSDATCLQPPHVLFELELGNLMSSALMSRRSLKPTYELVWTKAPYYVGEPLLRCEQLPDDIVRAMQKSIDDSIFAMRFCDFVASHSEGPPRPSNLDAVAMDLTIGKRGNPVSSFKTLYEHEIAGGLDAFHEICGQVMERLCRISGFRGEIGDPEREEGARMLRGFVRAAVRAGKIGATFPQLHINASLHAAIRFDDRRYYKRGDCEDFRHAGSALPYCNYFLTEKSLRHLLCTKPLNLESEYGVKVISDSKSAVRKLSALA